MAVVAWLPLGTKRSKSSVRSSSAALLLTAPRLLQLAPLFVENCQLPLPLVDAVSAMPRLVDSASVMVVPMKDATVCPGLVNASSVMPLK